MRDPYSYTFQSNLDYTDRSTGLRVCSEVSHTQMHPSAVDGRTMQAGITVSDLENRYQEYFLQLRAIQQFIEDITVILTSRSVLSSQTEPVPKRRMLSMSGSPVNRAHSGLRLLPMRPSGSPSANSRKPYPLPGAPSLTCPASFRS